jgi:hypothetical protein
MKYRSLIAANRDINWLRKQCEDTFMKARSDPDNQEARSDLIAALYFYAKAWLKSQGVSLDQDALIDWTLYGGSRKDSAHSGGRPNDKRDSLGFMGSILNKLDDTSTIVEVHGGYFESAMRNSYFNYLKASKRAQRQAPLAYDDLNQEELFSITTHNEQQHSDIPGSEERRLEFYMSKLKPEMRTALELLGDGLSYKEIAEQMNTSVTTAKGRIWSGRNNLEKILIEAGEMTPEDFKRKGSGKWAK